MAAMAAQQASMAAQLIGADPSAMYGSYGSGMPSKGKGKAKGKGKNGASQPPQNPEEKLRLQIEYYFSDTNLPKDQYLREQMDSQEGWTQLEILRSFPKI